MTLPKSVDGSEAWTKQADSQNRMNKAFAVQDDFIMDDVERETRSVEHGYRTTLWRVRLQGHSHGKGGLDAGSAGEVDGASVSFDGAADDAES